MLAEHAVLAGLSVIGALAALSGAARSANRSRAREVAEAAALAGAVSGETAARELVTASGGSLQEFTVDPDGTVNVRVQLGRHTEMGRSDQPSTGGSPASG